MHKSKSHAAANRPQDDSKNPSISALKSAVGYIARSEGTSPTCDGSGAAFSASFSAFVDWAQEAGVIRSQADFEFFNRPTDGHGDEHEAWFDFGSKRWFKATYPNRFGLAWGRDETATVHEYLLRLALQNEHFGDDIQLIALINCEGKIRILTSQPHIAGAPAEYDSIQRWFESLNFVRINMDGRVAWYFERENLLIADAHEGNIIQTAVGTMVPIDLNIVQPRGRLLEWVQAEVKGEAQMMLPGMDL